MTRIDFYYNADSRLTFACRIAGKAWRQEMRTFIYSRDDLVVRTLDKLMWSTPPTSFLPHCLLTDTLADETPVLIVQNTEVPTHSDLLVNLDHEPPPLFGRYPRLVEIVSIDDSEDQKAARERFRYYRDRGYALAHHDLLTVRASTHRGR